MFWRIFLFVFLEMSIYVRIFFKSSPMTIISAVSNVISVAEAPIAIPKSARAKAGASFIPSPTIATPLYFCLRCFISSSFWSGKCSP